MPSLMQPYDPGKLALQPTDRGTDARLLAGRRTAGFYNEAAEMISGGARAEAQAAGDIAGAASHGAEAIKAFADQQENFAGHREISAATAAGAKKGLDLQNAWDNLVKNADPNDPSVAANFRENILEPELQKFAEAYSNTDLGRQWTEQHVAAMRNHFYQKTAADMATLAGEAVKTNAREVINTNSNAAFKSPDFHTVDYLLGQTEGSVAGIVSSSPNVKGADSARLHTEVTQQAKESIVKAAAQGAIMKAGDPEAVAQQFADRYPTLINGAAAKQLAQAAKVQAKTNFLQNKQIEEYQLRQQERAARADLSKTFADNVSFDPATNRYTIKPEFFNQTLQTLYKYPSVSDVATRAQLDWGQRQQQEKRDTIITDKPTQAALYEGLFKAEGGTTEVDILKAANERKLDAHATSALLQLHKALEEKPLKGPIYHDTMTAVKGIYGDSYKGHEAYAKFMQTFVPEYIRQSKDGTLPPNALDLRDKDSLLSKAVRQWDPPLQDKMVGHMLKNLGIGADLNNLDFGKFGVGAPAALPRVTSKAEFDALKSGATYIGSDGKTYRKP